MIELAAFHIMFVLVVAGCGWLGWLLLVTTGSRSQDDSTT
jgi:hypothetical protein